MLALDEAIEVFVQAYCHQRSASHPYLASKHGDLWVMQDAPGRKRGPRKIEVVARIPSPEDTVSQIRAVDLGWHFISYLHPDSQLAEVKAEFKRLGYRAMSTEWLFVHDLDDIPQFHCDPPVRLIETAEQMAAIPQSVKQPRKFREGVRRYAVWDDKEDIGWVTSIPYNGNAWTAALYVHGKFRRQGYGRALMSRLLQDDKNAGYANTVLLASSAGAQLYPLLGFRREATLQIFCPMRGD